MLGKFIRDPGGKYTSEIIVLALDHEIRETLDDLSRVFRSLRDEFLHFITHGVTIEGNKYRIRILFVGYLKVC